MSDLSSKRHFFLVACFKLLAEFSITQEPGCRGYKYKKMLQRKMLQRFLACVFDIIK
jgi:hypothetical protein